VRRPHCRRLAGLRRHEACIHQRRDEIARADEHVPGPSGRRRVIGEGRRYPLGQTVERERLLECEGGELAGGHEGLLKWHRRNCLRHPWLTPQRSAQGRRRRAARAEHAQRAQGLERENGVIP
jgi:hypothetical protein